jgi:hypothetical protein
MQLWTPRSPASIELKHAQLPEKTLLTNNVKPDQDSPRLAVDMSHMRDLMILFLDVSLINADRIDPEPHRSTSRAPVVLKKMPDVTAHIERFTIDPDLVLWQFGAPCI